MLHQFLCPALLYSRRLPGRLYPRPHLTLGRTTVSRLDKIKAKLTDFHDRPVQDRWVFQEHDVEDESWLIARIEQLREALEALDI